MKKLEHVFYGVLIMFAALVVYLILGVNISQTLERILYLIMVAFILIVAIIEMIVYRKAAKKSEEKTRLIYSYIIKFVFIMMILMEFFRPILIPA